MGSTPSAKPADTPPEPETVKYTESEVAKARNSAKEAAGRKYGLAGTNATRGALTDEAVETKKKTLGGV